MSRRLTGLFALLIVGVLALCACGGTDVAGTGDGEGVPKTGGTYTFPLLGDPVSIEPLNAQDAGGMQVAHQVFQGLTKWSLDDDGTLVTVPDIASTWESTDARTWVFHLKKGVMFQAPVSREVTAQDFVKSWDRITDPENESYTAHILAPLQGCDDYGYQTDRKEGLTGVKALDRYTLEVTLRYPFAEFPAALGHPAAAVTPVDYIDQVGEKAYASKPVGTGPYVVKSWRRGHAIRLAKDGDYWDTENAGWVDSIDLPIFSDTAAMWRQFKKGDLDCSQVPSGDVESALTNANVISGKWTAKSWPILALYYVGFDMRDETLAGSAELRSAVAASANAAGVISDVGEGVPAQASGYVPEGVPGRKDLESAISYDPAGAAETVAGLSVVSELTYCYADDEESDRIADILGAGWEAAGIDVTPASLEWSTLLAQLAKRDTDGEARIFPMGYIADYPSLDEFLYPLFHSDYSSQGSLTGYSSQEVDTILEEARGTMDAQQRYNLYAQAELLVLGDVPAVPLCYYRQFRVSNERIGGFAVDPMGLTDMWTVWVK